MRTTDINPTQVVSAMVGAAFHAFFSGQGREVVPRKEKAGSQRYQQLVIECNFSSHLLQVLFPVLVRLNYSDVTWPRIWSWITFLVRLPQKILYGMLWKQSSIDGDHRISSICAPWQVLSADHLFSDYSTTDWRWQCFCLSGHPVPCSLFRCGLMLQG